VADALGAEPLFADVQALARRARLGLEEAPTPEPIGDERVPFGLTDREREVLALVAAGRSNGQIATALFISPKTVDVNLYRVYRKLDIQSRNQLARRLVHRTEP
jgi:DNA-binding CsgD family transcriptional regulator